MLDFFLGSGKFRVEMLLDGWLGLVVSLVLSLVGLAGLTWGLAVSQGLRRRILSLEFEVSDLQGRLLREIKSRAGRAGVKAKEEDEAFNEAVRAHAPSSPGPWWMQHVHTDLLKKN